MTFPNSNNNSPDTQYPYTTDELRELMRRFMEFVAAFDGWRAVKEIVEEQNDSLFFAEYAGLHAEIATAIDPDWYWREDGRWWL